jgi:DNA-binding transcriptional regulator YdaS (Cro superfamily)
MTQSAALKAAIDAAGGPVALGRELGISSAAISQWDVCPPLRVIAVEKASGVSRHRLRPDLYPVEPRPSEQGAAA